MGLDMGSGLGERIEGVFKLPELRIGCGQMAQVVRPSQLCAGLSVGAHPQAHPFSALPPICYPTVKATVQVVRLLGVRQKPMDRDNLALTVAGLVDALKPSYIV